MHEAIEFLVGHPVWTHEMASETLANHLKELVLEQHPELATFPADKITRENWQEFLTQAEDIHGKTVMLTQHAEERKENPIESLVRIKGDIDKRS
jgi:hypothetical protein